MRYIPLSQIALIIFTTNTKCLGLIKGIAVLYSAYEASLILQQTCRNIYVEEIHTYVLLYKVKSNNSKKNG